MFIEICESFNLWLWKQKTSFCRRHTKELKDMFKNEYLKIYSQNPRNADTVFSFFHFFLLFFFGLY